ncbi:VOC family protein [Oceanicola sp. 502str15]|nr:VOC family protein [Oceanicola sp. 502str15]
MQPHITVLTLAVADLEAAVTFYRDGLGLPTEGIIGTEFEHGAVAFFQLSGGLRLALWAQDDLAHDTGLPKTPISSTAVSIGHNVMTRAEVDTLMAAAARAGADVVKQPEDTFYGGYGGYFRDPDGHLWEIVWNPEMLPEV